MRILRFCGEKEIKGIMQKIKVDPYGIKIMLPKSAAFLVYLEEVNCIAANIIKQEMLSLGADAALSRGTLTGQTKKTGVLMIGNLVQLGLLSEKLKIQPFGLNNLGEELREALDNFSKQDFILSLREGRLDLGKKTHIMGIINLTPDSFSGDGIYRAPGENCPALALKKARELVADGASILDLGGQSTRPGSRSITVKEELKRVIPAIRLIAKKIPVPVSVDTDKPEVAKAALEAGAQMINDISGLRDRRMAKLAARYKSAVVIMHMLGKPVNMQRMARYRCLIEEISDHLKKAVESAQEAGVRPEKIVIDPGIGFAKTREDNFAVIKHLEAFKALGKPLLIGPSRKNFIAKTLGKNPAALDLGTACACLMAAERGAHIVRVHDVKTVKLSLKMMETVKNSHA